MVPLANAQVREGAKITPEEIMKAAADIITHYVIADAIVRERPFTILAGKIARPLIAKEYGGIVPE